MGHKNWKELKYRDMPRITWTGDNVDDVEAFVIEHGFGFSIGSPIRCKKNHDHDSWDDNDECEEDKTILEVYSSDWFDSDSDTLPTWTHADIGDTIFANGDVAHYGPATRLAYDNQG